MRANRMTIVALAGVLLLATGCSPSDPDGEGAEVVNTSSGDADDSSGDANAGDASDEPTDEPTEEEASEVGTRDNPLVLGTTAKLGDYEVSVDEVVLDATQQNLDGNQFNEAPPDGTQYVLVTISGKYVGEDSGNPGLDLSWKILGANNNTFDSSYKPDDAPSDFYPSCTLDSMYDIGETFPDGEFTGKICLLMESAQVDGSSVILESTFAFDDTRTFWATQ